LYGCETLYIILKEKKPRLEGFEERAQRRIFRSKREEGAGDCIRRSFITCTLQKILLS
jgi:hypothetical protein